MKVNVLVMFFYRPENYVKKMLTENISIKIFIDTLIFIKISLLMRYGLILCCKNGFLIILLTP